MGWPPTNDETHQTRVATTVASLQFIGCIAVDRRAAKIEEGSGQSKAVRQAASTKHQLTHNRRVASVSLAWFVDDCAKCEDLAT